jgi:hypothetical protein
MRGNFYYVHRFHLSVLHGDRFAAGCKVHPNFAVESAWPTADNVRLQFTNHGGYWKCLSTRRYFSKLIVSLKKQVKHLSLKGAELRGLNVDSVRIYYISLQVKTCFIRKECKLRIDLTFDDRL